MWSGRAGATAWCGVTEAAEAMSILAVMLMLLATWLSAGAVVLGLGVSAWRLCGLECWKGMTPGVPIPPDLLFDEEGGLRGPHDPRGRGDAVWRVWCAWWLGLIVLVGLLQAWHLVFALNGISLGVVGLLGLSGAWWCRAELALAWSQLCERGADVLVHGPARKGSDTSAKRSGVKGILIAWLIGGIWLANRASGFSVEPSTGLAWLPLVRWADGYAAVPGVGNVSPVYGWNAGWLLVCSWLSVGPWDGRIGHVGGGWVLWWLWLWAVLGWSAVVQEVRTLRTPHGVDPHAAAQRAAARPGAATTASKLGVGAIYAAALAVPVWVLGMGPGVTDPLPGLVSAVLVLVAAACVLRACGPDESHRGRRIDALLVSAGLCLGGLALDPMAAPALLAMLGFVAWRLMKSEGAWVEGQRPTRSIGMEHEKLPGLAARSSSVSAVGLAAGSVVTLWVARNVLLTGYPLFPLRKIGLPVDWAVPAGMADVARWLPRCAPGEMLGGTLGGVVFPAVVGLGGLMAWFGRGGGEGRWKSCAGLGAVLLVGVAGWYGVSARGLSATGPAWALAAIALALNARTIAQRGRPVKGPTAPQLATIMAGVAVVVGALHLATGAGTGLWPMGRDVRRALAAQTQSDADDSNASRPTRRTTSRWSTRPTEEPGLSTPRVVITEPNVEPAMNDLDEGDATAWLPVRIPGLSEGGLEERREPALRAWVSRWGVEIGLSTPDPDGDSQGWSGGAVTFDASTPGGVGLPWWANQPSVLAEPSEHLRYRGGSMRRGFMIDRRGTGSYLDESPTVRSAERGVFQGRRDGS